MCGGSILILKYQKYYKSGEDAIFNFLKFLFLFIF